MQLLRSIKLILTLKCDQSSRLLSESMDRKLPFSERCALRLHVWICASCRRFRRQIQLLRHTAHACCDDVEQLLSPSADSGLSPAARERIRAALEQAQDAGS